MSFELVYTSVPRGLSPNSSGFCTVAATAGISRVALMMLEGLSAYEFRYRLSDAQADLNPPNFAHTVISSGSERHSVLSRIGFSGADYSGRANKIAHHVLLTAPDRVAAGPAAMMAHMRDDVFHRHWSDPPGELAARSMAALMSGVSAGQGPAQLWQQVTGDAGWGGMLAKAAIENPAMPAYVIYDLPGPDILGLLAESLRVLDESRRWQVTFATYYTSMPAGCFYNWRAVLAGSPAAREALRFPNATVIDLTRPLGVAPDSEYATAARLGQVLAAAPVAAGPLEKPARKVKVAKQPEQAEMPAEAAPAEPEIRWTTPAANGAGAQAAPIPVLKARSSRSSRRPTPMVIVLGAVAVALVIAALIGIGVLLGRGRVGEEEPAPDDKAATIDQNDQDPTPPDLNAGATFEALLEDVEDILNGSPDSAALAEAESKLALAQPLLETSQQEQRLDDLSSRIAAAQSVLRLQRIDEVARQVSALEGLEHFPAEDIERLALEYLAAIELLANLPDLSEEDRDRLGAIKEQAQARLAEARDALAGQIDPEPAPPAVTALDRRSDRTVDQEVRQLAAMGRTLYLRPDDGGSVEEGFEFAVGEASAFLLRLPRGAEQYYDLKFDEAAATVSVHSRGVSGAASGSPRMICTLESRQQQRTLIIRPTEEGLREGFAWEHIVIEVVELADSDEGVIETLYQCRVRPGAHVPVMIGFAASGAVVNGAVERVSRSPGPPGMDRPAPLDALGEGPPTLQRAFRVRSGYLVEQLSTNQTDLVLAGLAGKETAIAGDGQAWGLAIELTQAPPGGDYESVLFRCSDLTALKRRIETASLWVYRQRFEVRRRALAHWVGQLPSLAENVDALDDAEIAAGLEPIIAAAEAYQRISPKKANASKLVAELKGATRDRPTEIRLLQIFDGADGLLAESDALSVMLRDAGAGDETPADVLAEIRALKRAYEAIGEIHVVDAWDVPVVTLQPVFTLPDTDDDIGLIKILARLDRQLDEILREAETETGR